MSFAAAAPAYFYSIPEDQREERCQCNDDFCIIDNGSIKHFFIRGCLEIPVVDGPQPFTWGVWATLSESNFNRAVELLHIEGRENEPPYFGWLSTSLPIYPKTLNLKTLVYTRLVGKRPFVELEPTGHPLAIEQQQGITMARVQEIVETLLHGQAYQCSK